MARILIIEDEPLIARDLKRILQKYDYQIISICYNSDRALDALAHQNYDLVLLDINLKGTRNGIELAGIINSKYGIPFIFVTSYADKNTINAVKMTHPAGYVLKPFIPEEIYSAIEIALYQLKNQNKSPLSLEAINQKFKISITPKEFSILLDMIDGMTNPQIAEKHFISTNTVKGHIKNIFIKLDTHSRAETAGKVLGGKHN